MLGSVRAVTNNSGAITECYDYTPFGRLLSDSDNSRSLVGCYPANPQSQATTKLPQRFTGKERDAESALDYFGARYYSSAQGRFVSTDRPFLDQHVDIPQSWNLYVYVRNNPLRLVDDRGEGAREVAMGLAKGTLGFLDNLGYSAVSLALQPDVAVRETLEGVRELSKAVFTREGREVIAAKYAMMTQDQKVALVTETALVFGTAALSKRLGPTGPAGVVAADIERLTGVGAAKDGLRVIGHFDEYLTTGRALGAKTFGVPEQIWNTMTETQRWQANVKFLDRGIREKAKFLLATPRKAIRNGSALSEEIDYLLQHGYSWSDDGYSLVPK